MPYKTVIDSLDTIKDWQEKIYKHLHQNPELSMQEKQTVAFLKEELTKLNYKVQEIGGGLVGILENGADQPFFLGLIWMLYLFTKKLV